jgi:hypothetical protein
LDIEDFVEEFFESLPWESWCGDRAEACGEAAQGVPVQAVENAVLDALPAPRGKFRVECGWWLVLEPRERKTQLRIHSKRS